MSFIAIDLGTSFIKGAVLDLERLRIGPPYRAPFPAPIAGLEPWRREFDPRLILAATRQVLEALLAQASVCEGLVMCSQLHGLVFTDERGEPRSNMTNWQDEREMLPHPSGEGSYFEVMCRRTSAQHQLEMGSAWRPGLPVGLFFWLATQGQLPGPELIPASLPGFVLGNLCQTTPTVDLSHAMAYSALNLTTQDWHHAAIAGLGLDKLRWPEIRQHGDVVGVLKAGGRSIPCYTPVGDYQAAIVGALLEEGELSLNISTGSQVSVLTPGLELGDYQTRPFFDGKLNNLVSHIPAGRALNALVKLLSELAAGQNVPLPDPWPYIAQQTAAAGKSELRGDIAFFASSCGDTGGFWNMRESNMTVGHLFRAAFENMAENYYANALRLSPARAWSRLVFSGGLAQKIPALREIICARFDAGYRICPAAEDTLLGLLALALAFSGRAGSVEAAIARLRRDYRGD